jgi:hypothetical protein
VLDRQWAKLLTGWCFVSAKKSEELTGGSLISHLAMIWKGSLPL